MLLHAFAGRAGAGQILAAAAGGQPAGVALLSAVSSCFALGEATLEQFKHLAAADAGPLAGLGALPDLRTIRPKLAALADRTDPVAVQRLFASAMLAADPVLSGVYYAGDHFVPYAGAKPVAKGWNNKRGKAERGRADTHVTAHDGRAVCFVTGEPSGLAATLAKALAELTKAAGPGAQIMVGFDRGGAYAQVFRHCRDQQAHWVTYRRAPLAVPAMLPVITTITLGGKARQVTWAEETTDIKDYGQARQITLFEHGTVALQILTSDLDACPADILAWLKSRWREENFLKYASENYGTDKICDYIASISANTKVIDNPVPKKENAAVREAEKALADAERGLAALLADPAITPAAKNTRLIPAAQQKITAARTRLDAAGIKGYKTNLAATRDGEPVTADFVIGSYHELWRIEKNFRMSKHDLKVRPVYHRKRESIDAHLSVVFAVLAVIRFIEARTGWSTKKFVRTARRYRTNQIRAGHHTLTAEDPLPPDLREALTLIK